jgi:acyl-CoA thioester hydrolase
MNNQQVDFSTLKLVHTQELDVRWSDLDVLGHVNNSVYLTYFEQARIEWWLSTGEAFDLADGEGPIMVTANCTIIKPIVFPGKLQINVHAGLPGNSSYVIYYEIFIKKQQLELAATGNTKIVWVNYKQGKSIPLPDKVRRHL